MTNTVRDSILFIDDEIACHSFVSLIVNNFTDYKLIPAFNGKEAIELATKNADKIFLILSDIMLPDIKGYDIFKSLKKDSKLSHIPFVFQSGLPAQKEELQKRLAQEVKVLDKPYKQSELLEIIQMKALSSC